nr:hypothetical protein [Tanacetum cinerariifolium]GEX53151.1 hypothetical protein [Tanacetum cinerariifolium]
MDMTIDQQVALDEALVPHASRLRIGTSNFRLRLDITSKESTLQVVYDVLRLTLFYKAFLVLVDVPETYMQEFWATTTFYHHLIRFKMNNKKCIVNLEYFREMLHICLRIPNQTFDELSFEEEILAFLRYLGHSGEIKKITDVNINKLYQPWRSFAAVINKCLIEHKDSKKSNEMYYPKFTKVIINFFMTKDPSIPRRNKVNWHYVRDDQMFTMIKLVSRHQNTRQFSAMLLVELTNKDIRNSAAYKEYYGIASGAAPPKTKESVRKTQSSFETTITPLTAAGTRFSTSAKGNNLLSHLKQQKLSNEDDDAYVDDQSDNDDDQEAEDEQDEAKDEESFDPIVQTPSHGEKSDYESNDDVSLGMNVGGNEGTNAEDDDDELYGDLNINLEGQEVQMTDVYTTQFAGDVSSIPGIVDRYTDHQMNEAVKVAVQIQSDRLRDKAQAKNEDFLNKLDENIQKIIKEKVKGQVEVQISKILPKIKKTVNEKLEAKVLTRSSNSSKTSYAVAADLSELELKKILNEKMESNKSIHRSNEQRNLYKALVNTYECDKIILDTYGYTVMLKRHRDDADKDVEPSTGSDRGSKRRREGKEPESTSALKEKASKTTDTLTPKLLASPTYELMKGSCKSLVELEFFLEEVYKATTDQLDWNNPEGQQYPHNLLKPLPLIPNSRGRHVIPFDHFINKDLEYLRGGASSCWVIIIINPLYLITVSFGVDTAMDLKKNTLSV